MSLILSCQIKEPVPEKNDVLVQVKACALSPVNVKVRWKYANINECGLPQVDNAGY